MGVHVLMPSFHFLFQKGLIDIGGPGVLVEHCTQYITFTLTVLVHKNCEC